MGGLASVSTLRLIRIAIAEAFRHGEVPARRKHVAAHADSGIGAGGG
jgi:hypothetical protein